jgi:hypothetical protein
VRAEGEEHTPGWNAKYQPRDEQGRFLPVDEAGQQSGDQGGSSGGQGGSSGGKGGSSGGQEDQQEEQGRCFCDLMLL